MRRLRRVALAAAAALAAGACGGGGSSPPAPSTTAAPGPGSFSFAVWGDTPYSEPEAAAVPELVEEINAARPAFVVNVGDIAEAGVCGDATYARAISTFGTFEMPLVYVPGDNEWTDCHRGGFDPLERLAHIRRTMFPSSTSFGRAPIDLAQQRPAHPENSRWRHGPVLFVGLNVPGSNNNRPLATPTGADPRNPAQLDAARAEFEARDEANRAWLGEAFEAARAADVVALIVVMQADPRFDVPGEARAAQGVDGYARLLATFSEGAKTLGKPLVIVHGDTHQYRFDQPLADPATGRTLANVTRIETMGSPSVGWVEVTLDPAGDQFVRAEAHAVLAGF